jgi:hypothetical protein
MLPARLILIPRAPDFANPQLQSWLEAQGVEADIHVGTGVVTLIDPPGHIGLPA